MTHEERDADRPPMALHALPLGLAAAMVCWMLLTGLLALLT